MAVAAVLALLAGGLWWLRRRGLAAVTLPRRNGGRLLRMVERLPLGPQHTLHVVRLGDRVLVVGCAPGGCALLAEVARADLDPARGLAS